MSPDFQLFDALRKPLQAFLDPAERIFWPAILSAIVLAPVVLGWSRGLRALRSGLLARRLWTHRSTRADIELLFVRAILFGLVRLPWLAGTVAGALWVAMLLYEHLGPADRPDWGLPALAVLYSLTLFVAWDFSRFIVHWAMHRFEVLWSFHQVHHSAEVLTPLTLYRVHPVESILYDARGLITTSIVTGCFLYVFRGTAQELQILGINALGFLFNVVGGNLRHSHVWLRFGWLERWFLSPAQHQLHHSRDGAGQRSNYGTWLAIWDRCFGTWYPAPAEPVVDVGLRDANHRVDGVGSILLGPCLEAARILAKRLRGGRRLAWSGAAAAGVLLAPRIVLGAPDPTDPVDLDDDPMEAEHPSDPDEPGSGSDRGLTQAPEESASIPESETRVEDDHQGVDFELDLDEVEAPASDDEKQESAEEPDYDVLVDDISIIGTPDARERIGGSAFVITKEELERKENDDIHRVLRSVPGVYVRDEDGFGLRPNIGLRGANSDRSAKITLMEDGILLSPAAYSAPAAYYFPLMTRMVGVEVFKGPASIRYGPQTIGGAINLQTRAIPHAMEGYADMGLGMRGYGKLHGFWGTTYKRFGVLLEAARIQSDGFKQLDGGGDTGFDRNDLMVKLRYGSDPNRRWYHQVDLKGGFGTERSNETYLGLTDVDFEATPYRRYAASRMGLMKWWRTQAEASYLLARGTLFDLRARFYRHDFDRAWRKLNAFRGADLRNVLEGADVGQTAVYAAILRGEQDSIGVDQALLIGTNARRFETTGGQVVTHVRPTWGALEQDIELGVRVHHDQVIRDHTEDAFLMIGGQLVPEGTERVRTTNNRGTSVATAVHAIDTLRIRWFSLMPGARVELIHNEFNNRLTATTERNFDAVFIPGIGAHAQATPWMGVLLGVHSGFSPISPGQPEEVKPERSINYEAGVRLNHRTKHSHTRFEVIGFFNDYSNMTSVCTLSSGCDDISLDRQFNAGRVYVWGAEVLGAQRVDLRAQHFLEVSVAYTYTGSSFRSAFSSASPQLGDVERGDELPYVPIHTATMGVGGGGRLWGVFPSATIVGDMRDVPGQGPIPENERIPLHYVVDLSTQVFPTKRSTLYLNIHNLTNNPYIVSRRPYGVRPGMPFQLMAGFKYHFG